MVGNFLSGRYARRVGLNAMMLIGALVATVGMLLALALFALGAAHAAELLRLDPVRRARQRPAPAERQCRHRLGAAAARGVGLRARRGADDRRRRAAVGGRRARCSGRRPAPGRCSGSCWRARSSASSRPSTSCGWRGAVRSEARQGGDGAARSWVAGSGGNKMRVACIGECMVELTLPREDGAGSRVGFAGDTLNVAVYLKRSAPEVEVAYVTALGTDPLSERMVGFFEGEGLDTRLIERRADRVPGLYAISLDARGRAELHLLARQLGGADVVPAAGRGDAGAAVGFRLRLPLGDHPGGAGAGGAGGAARRSCAATGRDGGQVAFDSNYRPRLWPDAATARRRDVERSGRLTDIGLPSLDDEMALFGEAGEAEVLARLRAAGVAARGAEARRRGAAAARARPGCCRSFRRRRGWWTPRRRGTASTGRTWRRFSGENRRCGAWRRGMGWRWR